MKDLGVAVVGAGYWGQKLIYEYLQLQRGGGIAYLKIFDPSASALRACKKKFSLSGELLSQSYEDAIQDTRISAVHIATPNTTHYDLVKRALEAGKNVLVEKPMTQRSRDAYELVALAESKRLVLQVGHIFRFNEALRVARRVLKSERLGKVYYVRVQWTDHCPPFPDRDIVFDLGPHPIDILNQLLERWPTQVSGFSRGYRAPKGEVAYIVAEFNEGLFAHIELSWLHPHKVREVSVVGSKGTLVVDCLEQHVTMYGGRRSIKIPVTANNTIRSQITYFIDSVREHRISRDTSVLGPRTVEVLERIRASMLDRPLPIIPQSHADLAGILEGSRSLEERPAEVVADRNAEPKRKKMR